MSTNESKDKNFSNQYPNKLSELSSDINEIGNDLASMWSAISEVVFGKQKNFQELALCYESSCDRIIIDAEKNEKLEYISGTISFVKIDNLYFECVGELYFLNSQKKWIVKKASSGKILVEKQLKRDAGVELRLKEKVSFEITKPVIINK